MQKKAVPFFLPLLLITASFVVLFAYDSDDQFSYNPTANSDRLHPEWNPNLRSPFRDPSAISRFQLPFAYLSRLDLDSLSTRLPKFDVVDVGGRLWQYTREKVAFDGERRMALMEGALETPEEHRLSFDLDGIRYDGDVKAPREFTQTFRDEKGFQLTKTRTDQISEVNPLFLSFKQGAEQMEREGKSQDTDRVALYRLPPPSEELVRGFKEKWTLKGAGLDGEMTEARAEIDIDKMDYAQGRWLKSYEGVLERDGRVVRFNVEMVRDLEGGIESFKGEIKGKGAPQVEVTWEAAKSRNQEEALALLRGNLPIPFLAGPRSATRMNGVDLSEVPLRVNEKGGLFPQQIPADASVMNLLGREDDGIDVAVKRTDGEEGKGLSLANGLRDIWYAMSGRKGEVDGMRKELLALRDEKPEVFLLAAGFSDPSFMSFGELKAAMGAVKSLGVEPGKTPAGAKREQDQAPALDQSKVIPGPEQPVEGLRKKIDLNLEVFGEKTPLPGAGEKIRPEGASRKEFGWWANIKNTPRALLEDGFMKPVAQAFAAVMNGVVALGSVVYGAVTMDWGPAKKFGYHFWNSITAIPANLAGFVLERIPNDAIRGFGEKLRNWGKGHGWGHPHCDFPDLVRVDMSKSIPVALGVGIGPTQIVGRDGQGKPIYLKENLNQEYFKKWNKEYREVIKEFDFVPIYTGNLFADIVYVAFEMVGYPITSRYASENYKNRSYEFSIGHSGGAAYQVTNEGVMEARKPIMVGAPGTDKGLYRKSALVVEHTDDFIVPHITPKDSGRSVGVDFTWRFGRGEGNVLRRPAPVDRMEPGKKNAHYLDVYMETIIPWMIEQRQNSSN
ncbi:MAG: hypothetical protein LHV69_04335 [Elusimicrobia bacterium]|nr:hypothetical protein [Candidatus Obscuribacterium magneticum]